MRHMIQVLLIIILLAESAVANVETVIAKIYPMGGLEGEPLFTQSTEINRESAESFTSKAKIVDNKGQTLMTETVVVKNGALVTQSVEQLQTRESWDLVVQGKTAVYRSFTIDLDKKVLQDENSVSLGEKFINGPMIEIFVSKNWQELLDGKSVKADFSVLELARAVTFDFSKENMSVRNGKKVVVLKMVPANFVISMFVKPLILEFDIDRKRLVYFKGRTPLKEGKAAQRPLEAEILYENRL